MPAAIFTTWALDLRKHFRSLSLPQATVLSQWSLGAILGRSCGLVLVASFVSDWLEEHFETTRQRLREFYCEAEAKAGSCRRQIDVRQLFAPLLGWIGSLWQSRTIVIALDATTLFQRLNVLSISVVFGSTAIPVAWRILRNQGGSAWEPHWCELLEHLRGVIPNGWTVIAMSDRGLYARWLFEAISALGWHPLMRINEQGSLCYDGRRTTLALFARRLDGQGISIRNARVFSRRPLCCTLLGIRKPHCSSPWLLVSDLDPEQITAECYALRAWIEHGFKAFKSGCFCWHRSRITDPQRAERMWLALSVATLYAVAIAADAEHRQSVDTVDALEALVLTEAKSPQQRRLALPKAGCMRILIHLMRKGRLPAIPKLDPVYPPMPP